MIPRDYISEWRRQAPWVSDSQVEQDLVLCRALVTIFEQPFLREALAFRGGTALYKLFLTPPPRFSEDLDLVQVEPNPAGSLMSAIREVMRPWIGEASYTQSRQSIRFVYRYWSEDAQAIPLKLKLEINIQEHFTVYGYRHEPFNVESRWFSGSSQVKTFDLDELLATKLRALYQRKKGRDLFDLYFALNRGVVNPDRVVKAFREYLGRHGLHVSRTEFERNLQAKQIDPQFAADVSPYLTHGVPWDSEDAMNLVRSELISRLN